MPCDSIQTTSVKLEQSDPELLKASLIALGWSDVETYAGGIIQAWHSDYGSIRIGDGRVGIDARFASHVDKLKIEYSTQALKRATGRFSWKLTETTKGKVKA